MAEWTKICDVSELREGEWRLVQVGTVPVALIRLENTIYAIDDRCPHRAGPLNEGTREGLTITCPWHQRKFDLVSGKSLSEDWRTSLKTFPTKIEHNEVYLQFPEITR